MTRASLQWKREYNNYRHASSDENKACFTAIEAGKLILIIHTYSSTKITRVSLQSKVDELLSIFHTYYSMEITRVSLQSKLDELLLFFHTYSSMKITRVSLQSKLDELMLLSTRILR